MWVPEHETEDEEAIREYESFVFDEIRYRLIKLICGDDVEGKRIYISTRKQLRGFRCHVNKGIMKWWIRFKEFQQYLPLLTWDAGNDRGERPEAMSENDIHDILYDVLDDAILLKWKTDNWDILANPVRETVIKVKHYEPDVISERARESRLSAIEEKSGIETPKRGGASNHNNDRNVARGDKKKRCENGGK